MRLSREHSRRQTRERLLAAASELFTEHGVNGTSVERIAERAGYSRGAFYGNFDDKHELIVELLAKRTEREREEIVELGGQATSPTHMADLLRAWHRARAEHLEGWLALRLELVLYALRAPEIRPLLAERELFARTAIAGGVLRGLADRDAQPPADPEFLSLIVHALEDGLLIQGLLTPDGVGDRAVVDAVDLLLDSWAALDNQRNGSCTTTE
ncbi:TetR/AcrR family transcriptional regulator [Streptosporangium sp. NPDC051023]|uniref:TetR/AcrR family transcriptional regulator n=1 Tax=Streptosporangium sp. NPDC051023 TaxID=3155410 RepID=UPI00344BA235